MVPKYFKTGLRIQYLLKILVEFHKSPRERVIPDFFKFRTFSQKIDNFCDNFFLNFLPNRRKFYARSYADSSQSEIGKETVMANHDASRATVEPFTALYFGGFFYYRLQKFEIIYHYYMYLLFIMLYYSSFPVLPPPPSFYDLD